MIRNLPPFRADHVGSLLRPAALKEARAKRGRDQISVGDLQMIEDAEIQRLIRAQRDLGLRLFLVGR